MESNFNPITGTLPAEVPLPKAPLVRVITQVRFPLIVSIEKPDFIAPFQEALRGVYPVLRQERTKGIVFNVQGIRPATSAVTWRFKDVDAKWQVSLAPDFVALETTSYSSRKDFFDRLSVVVNALEKHFEPKVVDRIGVRYIDRLVGPALGEIQKLIRPHMLGILGTAAAGNVEQMINESIFAAQPTGEMILLRHGRVPKDATVDPAAIDPINEPSWILDIDMFRSGSREFRAQEITDQARSYAERIYTFFRWAVSDDFLRHFGGKV